MQKVIKILYHNPELKRIEKFTNGDWIDLRASKDYTLKAGEYALIDLGVSMKLPFGYEAHIAPRSSTYKNWKILQTNSVAVIDNSYCGDNDIWFMPVYATEDTEIKMNDRICQFRIMKKMPEIAIEEVDHLNNKNRGGFGTTGKE